MAKLEVKLVKEIRNQYRKEGYWGDATLLDYWQLSAKSFPEKAAVIDSAGTSYSYGELDVKSSCLAEYMLESGVEEGDVISVQIVNWAEFTLIYIAALKVGAVINPLMPALRKSELIHRMGKCKTKIFFTMGIFRGFDYRDLAAEVRQELKNLKKVVIIDKGEPCEKTGVRAEFSSLSDILRKTSPIKRYTQVSADDVAIVIFTSGTEGRAKGVMLTHNNICANVRGYVSMTLLSNYDTMLMPVPIAHATGFMYGVTLPFMVGMTSVLQEKFEAEKSLELIEACRCSVLMGPTTIAYDILRKMESGEKWDLSSLRYFYCGGSPIPRDVLERGMKRGIKILGVYGQTESAPHCIMSPFSSEEQILKADGKPIPGVEIRIIDESGTPVSCGNEGEEYSRGPNLFAGYIGEEEMTEEAFADGWLKSGDLCVMDSDGYVRVTGRKKDIIIRGGENISSTEIEDILLRNASVKEAAVVAYPDERMGEKACAFIVLQDNDASWSLQEMRSFMLEAGIAKYKWPERLEIVRELPHTESGKVEKYKLRRVIKAKEEAEKLVSHH